MEILTSIRNISELQKHLPSEATINQIPIKAIPPIQ